MSDDHLFQVRKVLLDLLVILGQFGSSVRRSDFGERAGLAVAPHKPQDQRQPGRDELR